MEEGRELQKQIRERTEEHRDADGALDLDAMKQDEELQAMRDQLKELDREAVDAMARNGISDNVLPKSLEGDSLNQNIEWDKDKIKASAKDIAAQRLADDKRSGNPEAIWQSAQDYAARKAVEHPKEYATNYQPHTFATGDEMKPIAVGGSPEARRRVSDQKMTTNAITGKTATVTIGREKYKGKISVDENGDEIIKVTTPAWSATYHSNPTKR